MEGVVPPSGRLEQSSTRSAPPRWAACAEAGESMAISSGMDEERIRKGREKTSRLGEVGKNREENSCDYLGGFAFEKDVRPNCWFYRP